MVQNKETQSINPLLIIFILAAVQTSFGITSYQRIVFEEVEQDSWISILVAGIILHIMGAIVYFIVKTYKGLSLYIINDQIFGKKIGSLINLFLVSYFIYVYWINLANLLLIIKVWVFPNISLLVLTSLLLFLTIYGVQGGIRVIIGCTFIAFFMAIWMWFLSFQTLDYANYFNITPIFTHKPMEILKGSYMMTVSYLGFELLFFLLPLIKNVEKSKKFIHIGFSLTIFLYFSVMLFSIFYFGPTQLRRTVWATLTMYKIAKLPFLERMEIIVVSLWIIVTLPSLLLYMWVSLKGVKKLFKIGQYSALLIISGIIIVPSILIDDVGQVMYFTDLLRYFGLIVTVIYPVLLFVIIMGKKILRRLFNRSKK
ncbi:GerAB/ArcD/ProY family transporter [Bacillus carboniphilus]|uniref:GerAB/ArcD/ProY family transporter n=1 Tax=Bacillus carboniphilus TaxID=86663 RepID=A0ABY9JX71_9BACI|nr:GerAB/ArcD/ProY family transporter [Bacillus carboniphilus]WLR43960.1 GerAB/ArcD/ProY family transporter [Bacillus carboniphilus]